MFFVALPRWTDQFVNVTRSFEYNLLHSETLRQSLQIDFGDFTEVRLTCDNRCELRELCCLGCVQTQRLNRLQIEHEFSFIRAIDPNNVWPTDCEFRLTFLERFNACFWRRRWSRRGVSFVRQKRKWNAKDIDVFRVEQTVALCFVRSSSQSPTNDLLVTKLTGER